MPCSSKLAAAMDTPPCPTLAEEETCPNRNRGKKHHRTRTRAYYCRLRRHQRALGDHHWGGYRWRPYKYGCCGSPVQLCDLELVVRGTRLDALVGWDGNDWCRYAAADAGLVVVVERW